MTYPINDTEEKAIQLYKQGLKLREIIEQTGLKKGRVYVLIYRNPEIEKRQRYYSVSIKEGQTVKKPQSLNEELVQRIKRLTDYGYLPCEISQDVGIPKSKVVQVVNELKESNRIKMRV